MGSLGASWAVLASLGCVWGVLWGHLGSSEGVLEAPGGHLGASWEDLGMVLGSLGSFLKPFWDNFCKIRCDFELHVKMPKNIGKPMVFH